MRRVVILGGLFCMAIALAAHARAEETAKPDAAMDKGKEVYSAQRCQMCHSIAGKGNPKTPLDDVGGKLRPEEIRKYIVSPKEVKADSKMKAFPDLKPEELDALVAYLSSLKKP